jgi:putative tryptophan/tyrosine transport system substrate-binding protein
MELANPQAPAQRRGGDGVNRRRQLILAAGLSSLALPHASPAQPAQRVRRIGFLSLSKSANEVAATGRAMTRESLRRAGWEEGRNLVIERRYAEGEVARLDALAAEVVRLDVALILASLNTAIAAAKRATSNIPIVMSGATLPVELGFVQSLGHPGGNVTGTAGPDPETAAKAFQVLKEVAPALTRLAILFNPTTPGAQSFNGARSRAANALGMTVEIYPVTRPEDITAALERIAASRAEMLFVGYDGAVESRMRDITSFAIQHKILSIGTFTLFTSVGGAIYYGSNLAEIIDRTASYVDRILRGAKPADLPVEQATKFDLIINLKTMRALGITVPQRVLVRADELIQ